MRLVIQSGNQVGQVFELAKDVVTIGRESNSDIAVPDVSVSRNQCQIRREASGLVVQDSGSRNGTFVNGERIGAPRALRVGDTITVGKTTFRVEESTGAPTPSAPRPVAAQVPVRPVARGSNTGLWFGIGGALVAIVVLAMILVSVLSPRATQQEALTPTTVALTTTTPPLAQTAPAAAPTVTLAPTATPGTITPVTREETATPTSTSTPTATPTKFYIEPPVVRPITKAKFSQSDPILLSWESVAPLRPLDKYRVQVSLDSDFTPGRIACEIIQTNTQITLPGDPGSCNANWHFPNRYFWRVQVVAPDATGTFVVISRPEQGKVLEFTWQD